MPIEKNTSHVTQGQAKLISRLQKPRNKKFLGAYLVQVQKLEDAAWEVLTLRDLLVAEGVQLDILGKLVGRGRNGLSDDHYRLAIRTQIRINRSQGLIVDVLDVAILSVPDGVALVVREKQHATIQVTFPIGDYDQPTVLLNLQKTKAGGVRILLVWETVASENVFAYGSVTGPVARKGYGSITDPSAGGSYAWVQE